MYNLLKESIEQIIILKKKDRYIIMHYREVYCHNDFKVLSKLANELEKEILR